MTKVNIIIHGTGHPLVLFHGWGFDAQIWTSLLPMLTKQYRVFLVDLPGFGSTPFMDWDAFKTSLLAQMPARFALAGWSMGGLFATRLAIDEPLRVTHLVNIASSPHFIRKEDWSGVDAKIFEAFYNDLTINPLKTLQQFVTLQLQGQTSMLMLSETTSEVGLCGGLDVLLNWDLRQELLKLNGPVLYMFGRLDTIMPRKTMATMQRIYPHFNYMLFAKSAHAPFLSHPDEFIRALKGFLQ